MTTNAKNLLTAAVLAASQMMTSADAAPFGQDQLDRPQFAHGNATIYNNEINYSGLLSGKPYGGSIRLSSNVLFDVKPYNIQEGYWGWNSGVRFAIMEATGFVDPECDCASLVGAAMVLVTGKGKLNQDATKDSTTAFVGFRNLASLDPNDFQKLQDAGGSMVVIDDEHGGHVVVASFGKVVKAHRYGKPLMPLMDEVDFNTKTGGIPGTEIEVDMPKIPGATIEPGDSIHMEAVNNGGTVRNIEFLLQSGSGSKAPSVAECLVELRENTNSGLFLKPSKPICSTLPAGSQPKAYGY